uniref:Uncharacterized protein n=1 Tax=Trichuris muris TaxID=70415 RepID=A0A5S6PZK2_TRIMR
MQYVPPLSIWAKPYVQILEVPGCEGRPRSIGHSVRDSPTALGGEIPKIKSRPLNDRLFRQLCDENGDDFDHLLLHAEFWRSLKKKTLLFVQI